VGTAVTVGLGLASPGRVAEILRDRQRYRGVRAPAWGLTLVRVRYPQELLPDPSG
jgi:tRNA pseudouridine38-40 synthase